jgi:hypothetical protein
LGLNGRIKYLKKRRGKWRRIEGLNLVENGRY